MEDGPPAVAAEGHCAAGRGGQPPAGASTAVEKMREGEKKGRGKKE